MRRACELVVRSPSPKPDPSNERRVGARCMLAAASTEIRRGPSRVPSSRRPRIPGKGRSRAGLRRVRPKQRAPVIERRGLEPHQVRDLHDPVTRRPKPTNLPPERAADPSVSSPEPGAAGCVRWRRLDRESQTTPTWLGRPSPNRRAPRLVHRAVAAGEIRSAVLHRARSVRLLGRRHLVR